MVVKRHRPQRGCLGTFKLRRDTPELGRTEGAPLLTPWTNRVHSDDREPVGKVSGLCRSEDTLPRLASPRKARGRRTGCRDFPDGYSGD